MLKKLSVENYALIERLELELDDALNIITGETGAGKSILLGALGVLLGNRADGSAIKDESRNCVVEGVFDIRKLGLAEFFEDNDLEYAPVTVIRRVVSPGGKSRSYVNDLPVQLPVLKELGARLIDIHSQNQSFAIADQGFRTALLDSVAGQEKTAAEYTAAFAALRSAQRELERLKEESERSNRDGEWLAHQVGELSGARLAEGEQEELEERQNELSHAEEIRAALVSGAEMFDEDETGILVRLKQIEHEIGLTAGFYPKAEELAGRIRSALLEIKDVAAEFSSEAGRVESDPAKLEEINARLDTLYALQQKHKADSVAELIALWRSYEERLASITGNREAIEDLEKKIGALDKQARETATKLTAGRREAAEKVQKEVEAALSQLGMLEGRFEIGVAPSETLRSDGADTVAFGFSANKNIAPAPVEKIASGGEISRVMLALKAVAARSGKLPTIIFDEIDTGVSGRIADAVGNIINSLADNIQVVNITHLPQVASKGETHFLVYKENGASVPRTLIRRLSQAERVDEIAKMLSGSFTSDAARAQAGLLLGIIIKG